MAGSYRRRALGPAFFFWFLTTGSGRAFAFNGVERSRSSRAGFERQGDRYGADRNGRPVERPPSPLY